MEERITIWYLKQRQKSTMKNHKKEHMVLIQKPGSKYIFIFHWYILYFSYINIATGILLYFQNNNMGVSSVKLGWNGTILNAGCKSGIIKTLETQLKNCTQVISFYMQMNLVLDTYFNILMEKIWLLSNFVNK